MTTGEAITLATGILSFAAIIITALIKFIPSKTPASCASPQDCRESFDKIGTRMDGLRETTGSYSVRLSNLEKESNRLERRQDFLSRSLHEKMDNLTTAMNKGFQDILKYVKGQGE